MSNDSPRIRRTAATATVLEAMWLDRANEHYGYDLAKQLRSHQSAYAVFRKLESYGFVTSRWREVDGRQRKYYKLTGSGITLCSHWFPPEEISVSDPRWAPS